MGPGVTFWRFSVDRLIAIILAAVAACDFVGMCPSDPCTNDAACPEGHVCGYEQCLIPCESIAECPRDGGVRCYDPQNLLGFKVCADDDGVPGQMCDVAPEPGGA
jgi:hypothetical protein